MSTPKHSGTLEKAAVLAQAAMNAAKVLGLSSQDLQTVIGKHASTIRRHGLDPATKSGELALLFIRLYRSLHTLVGGDGAAMRHWMHTPNRDTGGIPAKQIRTVPGLMEILIYLDAVGGHH